MLENCRRQLRPAGMTPPEHTAALHVCQADLRAAVNDILREAQPQLLSPQLLPPPAAAGADGATTTVGPQQVQKPGCFGGCYIFRVGNGCSCSLSPHAKPQTDPQHRCRSAGAVFLPQILCTPALRP